MLNLFSSRLHQTCAGTTRRDFLKAGVFGLTGLMLPDILRARAATVKAGGAAKNTSVVWLWLGGGPTHIETFDPKMDAPAEYRSAIGAIKTVVPGVEIGGVFPRMAEVINKMALVRCFAHTNSGHGGGTHWVMTGYDHPPADNNAAPIKPSLGSMLARVRGSNDETTGLPTYVRLGGIYADGPAWLGPAYSPFDTSGNARNNMNLKVPAERLNDRRALLKEFDRINRDIDQTGTLPALDSFHQQAYNLILSKAKEVFDLSRESPRLRDQYGPGLGQQLLLARRLCEAGVGCATIMYGGWDMHGNIAADMKRLAPPMDQAVATFIEDIYQRGLDKQVLLVITGEFGRTPRINDSAGRDHWAQLSTLAFAGGGLRMGQVIGQSSAKAETPKGAAITPQDLMATLLEYLGIDPTMQFKDPSGRPVHLVESGKRIAELF